MNPARKKISMIRELMKERGLDAYIIPNTDPHLGEYISDHWRIISWVTGFTGSEATVVITRSFTGLWTDSRYFLQAEKQLQGTGIVLMRMHHNEDPSVAQWLNMHIKKEGLAGFDGRLMSVSNFRNYRDSVLEKEITFSIEEDLITEIWDNRPPLPESVVFEHLLEYSGVSRELKIARVKEVMAGRNIDYHLLTSPDDIMWLLNIRAGDVKYSPLLISYAIISRNQILLFTGQNRIPQKMAAEFDKNNIVILSYDDVRTLLSTLPAGSSLLLSPRVTSASLYDSIGEKMRIVEGESIPSMMKAVKNPVEISNTRGVMVRDGVALTKFFYWFENTVKTNQVTEESAAGMLLEMRLMQSNCTGESFSPIVAYNDHGALPHYSFKDNPETVIKPEGVLLVDSGGQYLDGTTDVTRSVSLGALTDEMKRDFTLALKGTIGLAMAVFPEGTRGYQLDILARKVLWDNGLNYGHGTGHGVGFFLNVHESPPSFSLLADGCNTPLEPGMIISDEPAIYRKGKYGFRTENLLLVTGSIGSEYGTFLGFETLTLCYIDTSLIDMSLLDKNERTWLNSYHSAVYERISPSLTENEKIWLKEKTRAL